MDGAAAHPPADQGQDMANLGMGDKGRESITASIGVLAANRVGESVRLWWRVWRWPTALLAGVVLWLALVTIAGATPPTGRSLDRVSVPASLTPALPVNSPHCSLPSTARWIANPALHGHHGLRTGFTPRRP